MSLAIPVHSALLARLQTKVSAIVSSQIFLMAPYVLSIIALVFVARKADYPRAPLPRWFQCQR